LDQALDAVNVTLTEDDIHRLEAGYEPHPVLGHV
jgi:hypothetical protein